MKTKKRLLSILLTLVLMLGLFPEMSLTALAYDGNPYASLVNTTTAVKFNNKNWCIIADDSTAVDNGTVTLLAKDTIASVKFRNDESNAYIGSNVKSTLDNMTASGGSFAGVSDAIVGVNLTDVSVNDAKLWLLSNDEVNNTYKLSDAVKKDCTSAWWLRSSNPTINNQAGQVVITNGNVSYAYVGFSKAIRPALKLDLSKVNYDSTTKTFSMKESASAYTVTYKVVNGTWSDDSTKDKTETVQSGSKPASVPTGMKAASGYTNGAWDTNPAETTITEAKTFTYTFTTKQAATVTKAPTAKNPTYNGQAQALVEAGTAEGGTMVYALGENATTAPADNLYTTSIPTATNAGTYYVWYKVKGDETHNDTSPVCISVTISGSVAETVTVTFEAGGGTGSMAPARMEKGSKFTFPAPEFFPPADRAFEHWKIGEKQYGIDDAIIVTADITVTAVWTEPKSRIETNDLTSVPKELKNTYSSITDLKKALLSRLSSNGIFASEENTEFHDVELMVRPDGIHWVKATEANFPVGKLTVKLAYPSGTGMNTHNFKVAHMFTTNVHGHTPGEIETPSVTKKEDGISVDLDGLSPVAVSWNKIDDKTINSLPQTGDTVKPLLYGFLALIALIGLGLLIKKK